MNQSGIPFFSVELLPTPDQILDHFDLLPFLVRTSHPRLPCLYRPLKYTRLFQKIDQFGRGMYRAVQYISYIVFFREGYFIHTRPALLRPAQGSKHVLVSANGRTHFWCTQDMLDQRDYTGRAALHHAVADIEERHQVLRALLSAKAEVNIRDARGNSPLHIACQHGHVDVVKTLIKYNANTGEKRRNNTYAGNVDPFRSKSQFVLRRSTFLSFFAGAVKSLVGLFIQAMKPC